MYVLAGMADPCSKEVMKMVEDFADGYYFSFPFNRVYMLQDIMGK